METSDEAKRIAETIWRIRCAHNEWSIGGYEALAENEIAPLKLLIQKQERDIAALRAALKQREQWADADNAEICRLRNKLEP